MQDDQSCSSAMRDDQSTIDVRVVHSKKGVIVRRGASTDTAEVARLEWGAAVRVAHVDGARALLAQPTAGWVTERLLRAPARDAAARLGVVHSRADVRADAHAVDIAVSDDLRAIAGTVVPSDDDGAADGRPDVASDPFAVDEPAALLEQTEL